MPDWLLHALGQFLFLVKLTLFSRCCDQALYRMLGFGLPQIISNLAH